MGGNDCADDESDSLQCQSASYPNAYNPSTYTDPLPCIPDIHANKNARPLSHRNHIPHQTSCTHIYVLSYPDHKCHKYTFSVQNSNPNNPNADSYPDIPG